MDSTIISLMRIAIFSRICILLIQVVFNIIPDHKADAFDPGSANDIRMNFPDRIVGILFDGFHKWDAKYFLHIAQHGYEKEQMFAFFPLFPVLLRTCASLLSFSDDFFSLHSRLLLSGFILNTIFFVGAAMAVYLLTLKVYHNRKFAVLCTILFCFNPASIFFSSNYTEALYAFCVFTGLYHLENRSYIFATAFLMGASATRSNGTVNAGFIGYYAIKEIINLYIDKEKNNQKATLIQITFIIIRTVLCCLLIFFPFASFNYYGYHIFCVQRKDSFIVSEWCGKSYPLIYSYVQSKHWDVGFLNYYQIKKLPNFILASPCVILMLYGILHFLDVHSDKIISLGLMEGNRISKKTIPQMINKNCVFEFLKPNIFVYVAHSLFLLLFGIFFMHIEVITRFFFSSSPLPIWLVSSFIYRDLQAEDVSFPIHNFFYSANLKLIRFMSGKSRLICVYFLSYIVIGTFMHVNYLPWT